MMPQIRKENKIMMTAKVNGVDWGYYDRFEYVNSLYLPATGEGAFRHNQIVTAVNKLVYKWYNDGDVYDNVHSGLKGWCNDLSSYANWLYKNTDHVVQQILEGIYDIETDDENAYEQLLKELADRCLDLGFLHDYAGILRKVDGSDPAGSIYDCDGPFEYTEHPGLPDTVGIDYVYGEYIITDEYGDVIDSADGFSTLDEAIRWCEEHGVEYDTTAEAEERSEMPDFVEIEWNELAERFAVVNDDSDEILEYFDDLYEAIDWCEDRNIDYHVVTEAWDKDNELRKGDE